MARYRGRPNRPQRPTTSKGVMFLCYVVGGYLLLATISAIVTHPDRMKMEKSMEEMKQRWGIID